MRISNINQNNFRGYDVTRLRGFYMQGLSKRGHKVVYDEMSQIAKKEGLALYLNSTNTELKEVFDSDKKKLSYWAQDCLAFIKRLNFPIILWNIKKIPLEVQKIRPLDNFEIHPAENYPRGGNYYLGYNEKGERWLVINSSELKDEGVISPKKPTMKELSDMFTVDSKNIVALELFDNDLDELIRPIKYPYVLVNDWDEALMNVNKFQKEYPKSGALFASIEDYVVRKKKSDLEPKTEYICNTLKNLGFIPIKIAGRYHYDINYLNALAWENDSDSISYLTNSVKGSYLELEFFEKMFEESLRDKVSNIGNVYFVSGGPRTIDEMESESYSNLISPGFYKDNVIMDCLAVLQGGIHCLTAEIPEELFK